MKRIAVSTRSAVLRNSRVAQHSNSAPTASLRRQTQSSAAAANASDSRGLRKPRIVFLCTGNACRSQMAEGWARVIHGHRMDVFSAGTEPHGLNARAVEVMREAGVDISHHQSQKLSDLAKAVAASDNVAQDSKDLFDMVVTVCSSAAESCPVHDLHGAVTVHRGFDDPPKLFAAPGDELQPFRRVRDEIRAYVENDLFPDLEQVRCKSHRC